MTKLISANASLELRTYKSQSSTHTHDYCQWVFPIQGALELEIENTCDLVNAQRAAFIFSNESHCFASNGKNSFLVLDIDPTNTWLQQIPLARFWDLPSDLIKFLPFAQAYLQTHSHNHAREMVKDFLFKLLSQHFISICDQHILIVKNWIDANFYLPINIKQLAKRHHLSNSQLQRRFKRALGQGIAEYWRNMRLQQAQQLLRATNQPIEVIANQTGYEDLSAFSRSFKQIYGISPSQWRYMQNT